MTSRARRAGWVFCVGACVAIAGCAETAETAETEAARGQSGVQDGFRATLVGAGRISTDVAEAFPAPDPSGRALYFSMVVGDNWAHQRLVVARANGEDWGPPEPLPFSSDRRFSDRAPRLAPDGLRLVFSSNRPVGARADHDPNDFNLWVVDRSSPSAAWSDARPLTGVNSSERDYHASITADGTLYFASTRPGGRGRSDIYRAVWTGNAYAGPESVGAPINTEQSEPDLLVSPDGTMMILVITDHPSGRGGDDLYVSFRRDGSWTEPRNLGPAVNTSEYEYGPTLSPDGRYLYFTSHRSGGGDIYRIAMTDLDLDQ